MALQAVLDAVRETFHPQDLRNTLAVGQDGRVNGAVVVIGSTEFQSTPSATRYGVVWRRLRETLGPESTQIGPFVLVDEQEAMRLGL